MPDFIGLFANFDFFSPANLIKSRNVIREPCRKPNADEDYTLFTEMIFLFTSPHSDDHEIKDFVNANRNNGKISSKN